MAGPTKPISVRPLLQPGMPVSVYRGYTGTLGGFAVTKQGDIVMMFAEHQLGEAQLGDPILLEPHGISIGMISRARITLNRLAGKKGRALQRCFKLPSAGETHNVNLRLRGMAENLPIVLKQPVLPEVGRLCVKSGFATGVTYGRVAQLDRDLDVELPDGTFARFVDQIATEPMARNGDSGSLLFTADTFEPVGLLSSGNQLETVYSKLTGISELQSLAGVYSPISLPTDAPPEVTCIIASIIPDGFFAQKSNLLQKSLRNILDELGVAEINSRPGRGFSAVFRNLIHMAIPHLSGDEGSIITTEDRKELIGLSITGDEKNTFAIQASRVFEALNLELIRLGGRSWKMLHGAGYARKFCDNCKVSLYPDTAECPYCGRIVYWGRERLEHYLPIR